MTQEKTLQEAKDRTAQKYCYSNHNPYENFNSAIVDCIEYRKTKQLDAIIEKSMILYHQYLCEEAEKSLLVLPENVKGNGIN